MTLIGLAGIFLYLFRLSLLDVLLHRQLTSLDIPVSALEVQSVSLHDVVLTDFTLGDADQLHIGEVRVRWLLPELFSGEIQAVEITGLRLELDLRKDDPLAGLLPSMPDQGVNTVERSAPRVLLRDTVVSVQTSDAAVAVYLNGNVQPQASGVQAINLNLETKFRQGVMRGSLAATVDTSGEVQGTFMISDGTLNGPVGFARAIKGTGQFTLVNGRPRDITAELDLSDIGFPLDDANHTVFEQVKITLELDEADAHVSGKFFVNDHRPSALISVAVQDYLQRPAFEIDLKVDVDTEDVSLPVLSYPDAGVATASLLISGKTPPIVEQRHGWLDWLQQSTVQGQGSLSLKALKLPQHLSDLTGDVALDFELGEGEGHISIDKESVLTVLGLSTDWIQSLDLPEEFTSLITAESRLSLTATGDNAATIDLEETIAARRIGFETHLLMHLDKAEAAVDASGTAVLDSQGQILSFDVKDVMLQSKGVNHAGIRLGQLNLSGEMRGEADNWNAQLDIKADAKRLRLPPLDARQAKVNLPLLLKFNRPNWTFSLRKPGRVSLKKLAPVGSVEAVGPLSFKIDNATAEVAPDPDGFVLEHKMMLRPDSFLLSIQRQDAPALELKLGSGKIRLSGIREKNGDYRSSSTLVFAGMDLPQYQMALDDITANVQTYPGTRGIEAEFDLGQLQYLAATPYFAPLDITGIATLQRQHLSIDAHGGVAGTETLKLSVNHALENDAGTLTLTMEPFIFSPDALQPITLVPGLAELGDVTGQLRGDVHFNWSQQGVTSGAGVAVQDLSFDRAEVKIAGLTASLEMTDLMSPTSRPKQQLEIQRIELGTTLEDLQITYQIASPDGTRIDIDQASVSVLGGKLSIGSTTINPADTGNDVTINVDGLDLQTLFELIEVEGLAGEGRLDGRIPLKYDGGQVSIQNGFLEARAPGILRLKSDKVSQLLAGRAEDVDLLLQALAEFHYSELSLKLENSSNNDLVAALSMLGNNPRVLNGRSFRLNINLESNIGKILDAIAIGYGLSNQTLQKAFSLRSGG